MRPCASTGPSASYASLEELLLARDTPFVIILSGLRKEARTQSQIRSLCAQLPSQDARVLNNRANGEKLTKLATRRADDMS